MSAVFAGSFNGTISNLLKRPISEKWDATWIDVLPTLTKQNNNRIHSTTKLTPKEASLKKNESYVDQNFLDKRKKVKPEFQVNDLVRTADLKRTFSKGDTNNWSYKKYKITEFVKVSKSIYKTHNLLERYNESLLKKTELTIKENDSVLKKLNII